MLVGPALAVTGAWGEAVREPLRGDWRNVPMWLGHAAMLVALLWWVRSAFGVAPLFYLLAISYPICIPIEV
ncbi:MAG TPA: hypothetical protein VN089_15435 [Duganella sp.]|nr:hypothetical protein [Duganella sp.]